MKLKYFDVHVLCFRAPLSTSARVSYLCLTTKDCENNSIFDSIRVVYADSVLPLTPLAQLLWKVRIRDTDVLRWLENMNFFPAFPCG